MQKTDATPLWVFLAFSAINRRKEALILIWASVLFTLYCIPWAKLIEGQEWVAKVFLIDDWSWAAMMIPITIWYWLSLRWADAHNAWTTPETNPA